MTQLINELRLLFSSIKLAVWLIAAIALLSILGTLIPQGEAAREFLQHRPAWFVTLFSFFDLGNVFRSFWYVTLLGLFTLNLVVCSWNRFPMVWKLYRQRQGDPRRTLEKHPSPWQCQVSSPPEKVAQTSASFLKKKLWKTTVIPGEGETFVRAEKGAISYLGAYIIHAGMLIIVIGALGGIFFGFKGYVEIAEGETVNRVRLFGQGGVMPLGFSVTCDNFTVEFYDTGHPKLFRSDLTFRRGDEIIRRESALVNHPIEIEGIRFYQSSYHATPVGAWIGITREGQKLPPILLTPGKEEQLPGGGRISLARLEGNLMELGPAARVTATLNGEAKDVWLFQHAEEISRVHPEFMKKTAAFDPDRLLPYRLVLDKLEEKYSTGLQVNRDPGAPIVLLGSLLVIWGLAVAFFYPYRQLTIRLASAGGGTQITLVGRTNKGKAPLEGELERLQVFLANNPDGRGNGKETNV